MKVGFDGKILSNQSLRFTEIEIVVAEPRASTDPLPFAHGIGDCAEIQATAVNGVTFYSGGILEFQAPIYCNLATVREHLGVRSIDNHEVQLFHDPAIVFGAEGDEDVEEQVPLSVCYLLFTRGQRVVSRHLPEKEQPCFPLQSLRGLFLSSRGQPQTQSTAFYRG